MRLIVLLILAGCYAPEIRNKGYKCETDDDPACPPGFQCRNKVCELVTGLTGAISIGKTENYSGEVETDPTLNSADTCPDVKLGTEPGDSPDKQLIRIIPPSDSTPTKTQRLAICPKGDAPWSHAHDVDFFKIDATAWQNPTLYLKAEITYDIKYGDLDLALIDTGGAVLDEDGSAKANGCVAFGPINPDFYYVAVVGANNVDTNTYELKVSASNGPRTCSMMTSSSSDMGQ